MKTKTFSVPVDQMLEFAAILSENELTNRIVEPDEDDTIVIEVEYEPEDKPAIFDIMELLDDEL